MRKHSGQTLLWLVAIGFFMETLDATIVNTALPTMARDLKESPLSMQSVVISYALTLAIFIPASGWLTDRFGVRRVYLWAISIFTLGSIACALAPNLPILVAARVLQGTGGSMLLPVGRLAILRAFPGESYLPALSFVTMPALIGPLVGPSLGGWLVQFLSWHWIFLINIPIGIIGIFATYKTMPPDVYLLKRRFDFLGFVQVSAFMVCVSVALDGASGNSISKAVILILFVCGFASLASYSIRAIKHPNPLVSFALFRTRTFTIGILGNLFARLGTSSMPFLLPLYLQLSLNYGPFKSGTAMLPLAAAAILGKRLVTPVVNWMGYRKFLIANTVIVGILISSFSLIGVVESTFVRYLQFFIFGAFNSMQFTAMNTITMKDLSLELSGHGNAMFSMVQMVAMSFSVAAAGSLLSNFMEKYEGLQAFQLTFICMGAVTFTSAWIFAQLNLADSNCK